jgi:hypothetical protein
MDLDDDPESDSLSEIEALRWLHEMLRNEADNIRKCVPMAQGPETRTAKAHSVTEAVAA